jgi:hypothetical protein
MSDTGAGRPARSCDPFCLGAAAAFARLLAAHTEARPLLTAVGETYVRYYLAAAKTPDAIPGPFDPAVEFRTEPDPDAAVIRPAPPAGPAD